MLKGLGFTAFGSREAGHRGTLRILARHMRDQVFERLPLDRFPRARNGDDKAAATGSIVGVALLDQLYIVLGAIGSNALDNHPLGPGRRTKVAHHLAKQSIFRLVLRMAFGPNKAKGHRQTVHIPVDDQQGEEVA